MNKNECVIHFINTLDTFNLLLGDGLEMNLSTNYWLNKPQVHLTVFLDDFIKAYGRPKYSKFKRLFGPFKEQGKPPDLYLKGAVLIPSDPLIKHIPYVGGMALREGVAETVLYEVNTTVYSPFECKVVEEIDEPLSIADLNNNREQVAYLKRQIDSLETATSKVRKVFSCDPVELKVRDE